MMLVNLEPILGLILKYIEIGWVKLKLNLKFQFCLYLKKGVYPFLLFYKSQKKKIYEYDFKTCMDSLIISPTYK